MRNFQLTVMVVKFAVLYKQFTFGIEKYLQKKNESSFSKTKITVEIL